MAVPFSNTKLRVPRGFQNLLEGFAREVLRSQPEELYAFGAQYFETLMKQREETGIDPAEHGAKMEDRFYNNKAFIQPEIDASDPQQQDAALAIQTKFRQHAAKQEVDVIRNEKAATKIQAGFRGYKDRQRVKDIRDGKEDLTKPEKMADAEEEVDIDLTDPEVEAAAVKIQAGFKGYKTRRDMGASNSAKSKKGEEEEKAQTPSTATLATNTKPSAPAEIIRGEEEEEVDIDLEDPEVEKAALKIQAGFRGMMTRNTLKTNQASTNKQKSEIQEPFDINLEDPEVEQAALKIQAGFKGMRTRKQLQKSKGDQVAKIERNVEKIDIDLDDPKVEKAASKIQAGFRGMQTRKDLRSKKSVQFKESTTPEAHAYVDLDDTEVQKAATKIQARYRGMKTRNELRSNRMIEADILKLDNEVQQSDEIDIDLNDPEVEKAAVKIQAGFKGLKTRKQLAERRAGNLGGQDEIVPAEAQMHEEPVRVVTTTKVVYEVDRCEAPSDFNEADVEAEEGEMMPEEEEVDIDLNDPNVEAAAVKIQAGFKGFKTRKDMAERKSGKSEVAAEETLDADKPADTNESTGGAAADEGTMEETEVVDEATEEHVPEEEAAEETKDDEPTAEAESAEQAETEEKPADDNEQTETTE